MKIDKRSYEKLVSVLNNGIEQIISGEPDKQQKEAVKWARKLIEKCGYKAL